MPRSSRKKGLEPTNVDALDKLANLETCSLDQYINAASAYVLQQSRLTKGQKKAGQIRLSNALGKAFVTDLNKKLSRPINVTVGERPVAGALRPVKADVTEVHPSDGPRLAVELKPVNLAVGRAIWNRFGDIRTFAVNIHLKFPFCVVGGVLAIPTSEETGTPAAEDALAEEAEQAVDPGQAGSDSGTGGKPQWKSTRHLIQRAVARLVRAGGRRTEADAPHLLEGIAVVVYDPKTGRLDTDLPEIGSGLRWEEFVSAIASSYEGRFEN